MKVKPVFKKVIIFLLIIVSGLALWKHELIIYGIRQGYGQFKIIYYAKPVKEVLADPSFPDSLKQKLLLIEEIKKFAFDSLHINFSKNYSSFYDQQGKPILWIVTASEPYKLKAKEWDFPFVGKVSYKGFFEKKLVIEASNDLKKQGFDIEIDEVAGWSTLGWFHDPVLSSMLKYDEGKLAALIIHELTHGTLFVKDRVDFNENLADFVGDYGAEKFLENKYGKGSLQYLNYKNSKSDYILFSEHILRGTKQLEKLYLNMDGSFAKKQKDKLKYQCISHIMKGLDSINFSNNKWKRRAHLKSLPNNAFFIDYVRYRSKQNIFKKEFEEKFKSDFKLYFEYLKKKYPV